MRVAPELCLQTENTKRSLREPFAEAQLTFERPAAPATKGKAERRKAHCPTNVRDQARRARCLFAARPPFGAHARGTRHRLLPRWLSSRTGFPAAAADRCFARFAKKMPRLSTLRADRSLCRSTGDPKPPGSGSGRTPARGHRISLSSIRRHRLTSLNNERDGRRYRHRDGKVKGV